MGGACSTGGRREKCIIWFEYLKGRDRLEDVSVDGRIMLECRLGK
jgi:hypothetical protein